MKRLLSIFIVFFFCVPNGVLPDQVSSTAPLTKEQKSWLSRAERHERAGWVYLHIEGRPRERGFQHGYLMAKEIAEAIRVRREIWKYTTGMKWEWLVEKSAVMYTPKVDAENRSELEGMVEGLRAAGIESRLDELVAFNAWFDLAWYWWPEEKKKLGAQSPNPPKQGCSAFIATGSMTSDGAIVLAHNTMNSYPEADFNVILDLVPARGYRILMQTTAGWIHSGPDFFITSAGLIGTETTIGGFSGFDEKGIPEFVRFRRATQDASSIDEWASVMQSGNNGGYANSWLIGDVNTNEIARLEIGLRYTSLEKKRDGFFTGSNITEDLRILRLETNMNSEDIRNNAVSRRVRWNQLMAQFAGKIDLELAKRFEADHYDMLLQKENPGSHTLCSHGDLDPEPGWPESMPFNPMGTYDAKVVDSRMAKGMSFAARWGSACGTPFDAVKFLEQHTQFDWMDGILKSRPSQPWTAFRAGEKKD
jgi:hypothetical protein